MATEEPTLVRQELVEQQIIDIESKLFQIIIDTEYQQKRQKFIDETLVPQLEMLAKFLGPNEWLTSKFSYVDIMAYEILDRIRLFAPESFKKFPILEKYLTRFENLGPIKEYQNSSNYKSWPIFGPLALWGWK